MSSTDINVPAPETVKSLFIRNNETGKVIEAGAYYNMKNFPLKNKALNIVLEDGTKLYVPVDYVGSEFDTGLRYNDGSNVYQISSQLVFDIITYKLTACNMLVPVSNTVDLYVIFTYLFGKNRVKLVDNTVRLICPSPDSGITKLFFLGTAWNIMNNTGLSIQSEKGGNPTYVVGNTKEKGFIDRAMLIKMNWEQELYISLSSNEEGNNYIVLGLSVEGLKNGFGTFEELKNTESYCIYDKDEKKPKTISGSYSSDEYTEYKEYMNSFYDYEYNYIDIAKVKADYKAGE